MSEVVVSEQVKETLSDEEMDTKCDELIQLLKNNNFEYSDEIFNLAKLMASNSKDYLDDRTYCYVMYVYHLKYANGSSKEDKNSDIFILLELKRFIDSKLSGKKRAKALTFTDSKIDDVIIEEVDNKTTFVNGVFKEMKKKLLMITGVVGLLASALMLLLMKIDLLVVVSIFVLISFGTYFLNWKTIKASYFREQIQTSRSYCKDQEIVNFDMPIFMS